MLDVYDVCFMEVDTQLRLVYTTHPGSKTIFSMPINTGTTLTLLEAAKSVTFVDCSPMYPDTLFLGDNTWLALYKKTNNSWECREYDKISDARGITLSGEYQTVIKVIITVSHCTAGIKYEGSIIMIL